MEKFLNHFWRLCNEMPRFVYQTPRSGPEASREGPQSAVESRLLEECYRRLCECNRPLGRDEIDQLRIVMQHDADLARAIVDRMVEEAYQGVTRPFRQAAEGMGLAWNDLMRWSGRTLHEAGEGAALAGHDIATFSVETYQDASRQIGDAARATEQAARRAGQAVARIGRQAGRIAVEQLQQAKAELDRSAAQLALMGTLTEEAATETARRAYQEAQQIYAGGERAYNAARSAVSRAANTFTGRVAQAWEDLTHAPSTLGREARNRFVEAVRPVIARVAGGMRTERDDCVARLARCQDPCAQALALARRNAPAQAPAGAEPIITPAEIQLASALVVTPSDMVFTPEEIEAATRRREGNSRTERTTPPRAERVSAGQTLEIPEPYTTGIYIVKPGDSWARIARQQIGKEQYWMALRRFNAERGKVNRDTYVLYSGEEILVPRPVHEAGQIAMGEAAAGPVPPLQVAETPPPHAPHAGL